MLSVEETHALAEINPELEENLKAWPAAAGSWKSQMDIYEVRSIIANEQVAQAALMSSPSTLPYINEDIQIKVRDGSYIGIRVYKPLECLEDGCPGFVVFHGGAFMIGGLQSERWLCSLFASVGGIAINVNYRLAPENPFPVPVHDCFDAVKWVASRAKQLGINTSKGFLIGGEDSGGDIALSVAHLYRDEKSLPRLTGIYASVSSAANLETVPDKYKDNFFSMEQIPIAPLLSVETLEFSKSMYKPDPKSPLAYAIAFPSHTGIPKTYFQACGLDPVRDSTLVTEQVWKDAGIPTRLDIYPGLPHAFWAVFPGASFSKKHFQDSKAGIQWLLSST